MDLMQRRRVMLAAGEKPRLPREYQEVKWIGALESGSQYISLPHIASKLTGINLTFSDYSSGSFLLGCFKAREIRFTPLCNISSRYVGNKNMTYNDYLIYTNRIDLGKHTLQWNIHGDNTALFDSDVYSIGDIGNGSERMSIFSRFYNNAADGYAKAKIFVLELYNSGIITANFVPCYRKSDNKPGMYDLCGSISPLTNSPFYINAGTGEFLVGPDVN